MAINNNDLDKLAGKSTLPAKVGGAINEGTQTIDKVKSIVEGVASILNKVQQFKSQAGAGQPQQAPATPVNGNVPQSAPIDMQSNKRATIKIDDIKLMAMLKEFAKQIPEPFQEMPLKSIIERGEGNEQIIKSFLVPLIKQVTIVEYVN